MRKLFFLILLFTAVSCQTDTAVSTPISQLTQPTPTVDATPTLSPQLDGAFVQVEAAGSPTAVSTVTPFPTPSVTPQPAERVELGTEAIAQGNFSSAIEQFETGLETGVLNDAQVIETRLGLGIALLEEEQFSEAATALNDLIVEAGANVPDRAYFHLAQARVGAGDWQGALDSYQAFLDLTPELTAYIAPLMAEAQQALDNSDAAVGLWQTAVSAPAHRLTTYETRQKLAAHYQSIGNTDALIAQYDAMLALARTDFTQAELTYLAGMAELERGNVEAANGRFTTGIVQYPTQYNSYLGLVQLVEAGVPVNEYQRGLVNYHASAWQPCVAAFDRFIAAPSDPALVSSAQLLQAYCYEGLGDYPAASALLEQLAIAEPATSLYEWGWMLHRAGNIDEAEIVFAEYLANYPNDGNAPEVAWQTAVYAANRDQTEIAIERFSSFAAAYSWHEDAPEALYRAGLIAEAAGDLETAVSLWDQGHRSYPTWEYGNASTVMLLRTLPSTTYTQTSVAAVTQSLTPDSAVEFYGMRAEAVAFDEEPFVGETPFILPSEKETAVLQNEAEIWLRDWLGIEAGVDVSTLRDGLANDPRLVRGTLLWEIGLLELAKRELEAVRTEMVDDPLASYQLALYFRDIGLYRSSIWAATAVLNNSGQSIREAPRFIGQLIYPVYYADLILPLAEQYGYDPRLQFALVRQESLFESFARSGAAAQGLSQVIPDTGVYIAQQLNWPNFENDDLYQPYVGLNFGAFYLAQQLGFFDNSVHAALAAYNGGPGNANRWYQVAGDDIDRYHQTVDFFETRSYIRRIYVGFELYEWLYQ